MTHKEMNIRHWYTEGNKQMITTADEQHKLGATDRGTTQNIKLNATILTYSLYLGRNLQFKQNPAFQTFLSGVYIIK